MRSDQIAISSLGIVITRHRIKSNHSRVNQVVVAPVALHLLLSDHQNKNGGPVKFKGEKIDEDDDDFLIYIYTLAHVAMKTSAMKSTIITKLV